MPALTGGDHQIDRSTGVPVRYVREHPGELLHVDMKPIGYEIVHVAVDDASRLAFVQVLPDRRGPTVARFMPPASSRSRGSASSG